MKVSLAAWNCVPAWPDNFHSLWSNLWRYLILYWRQRLTKDTFSRQSGQRVPRSGEACDLIGLEKDIISLSFSLSLSLGATIFTYLFTMLWHQRQRLGKRI